MEHYLNVCDVNGAKVAPVDIVSFGSPCFPAGTLVLTKDRFVPIEDIRVGDIVFTHRGNWKPVTDVGYQESPTIKLRGSHYGLITTPDHPFYSLTECEIKYDGDKLTEADWIPAKKMRSRQWAVPCKFSGLEAPQEIERHPWLLRIVGGWLSDSGLQGKWNEQPFLKEWLKRNFRNEKYLPTWALCLKPEQRMEIMRGFFRSKGNGCYKLSARGTTKNKQVAHGIRLLCESLGYACSLQFENGTYRLAAAEGQRLRWGGFSWHTCWSVEPHRDRETVYNITVADDHSYIVEGFAVHNCQDLSVAGKRTGMKHADMGHEETTRSGLFMEAVRIIREMREATDGKQPRYALWENVPGAFSSNKGQDFRVVLEELAKIADETASVPMPEKGKWTNAGSILGDGYSICWRTLDAQYHGVPQRRRRIFLVADFAGESAEEILFECTGLPGYPPQSGEEGENATANLGSGSHEAGCYGIQGSMIGRADKNGPQGDGVNEDVSFTLNTIDRHGVCCASGFCTEHSANSRSIGYEDERSPTLRARRNSGSCT